MDDENEFVILFDRDDRAIGVLEAVVQLSTDMRVWDPVRDIGIGADTVSSDPAVTIADNGATDQVRVRLPIGPEHRKFARLKLVETM